MQQRHRYSSHHVCNVLLHYLVKYLAPFWLSNNDGPVFALPCILTVKSRTPGCAVDQPSGQAYRVKWMDIRFRLRRLLAGWWWWWLRLRQRKYEALRGRHHASVDGVVGRWQWSEDRRDQVRPGSLQRTHTHVIQHHYQRPQAFIASSSSSSSSSPSSSFPFINHVDMRNTITRTDNEHRNKYVRLRGRPYIHTCRPTSTRRAIFHERRICSVSPYIPHRKRHAAWRLRWGYIRIYSYTP